MEFQSFGVKDVDDVLSFRTEDVLQLSKQDLGKVFRMRIVTPVMKRSQVWTPIMREDQQREGTFKPSWTVFNVPTSGSHFFSPLETLHRQIAARHLPPGTSPADITTQFTASVKYVCGAICRDWDPDGKGLRVTLVEGSKVIWKDVREIMSALDPEDATKLLHGHPMLFDVLVKVYRDPDHKPGSPDRFSRRYSVEPYGAKNKFAGKLPLAFRDGIPPDFKLSESGAFTEPESAMLVESGFDIGDLCRPATHDEIIGQLLKNPLNLFAQREDQPVFPYADELCKELLARNVPCLTEAAVQEQMGGLPGMKTARLAAKEAPKEQVVVVERPETVEPVTVIAEAEPVREAQPKSVAAGQSTRSW